MMRTLLNKCSSRGLDRKKLLFFLHVNDLHSQYFQLSHCYCQFLHYIGHIEISSETIISCPCEVLLLSQLSIDESSFHSVPYTPRLHDPYSLLHPLWTVNAQILCLHVCSVFFYLYILINSYTHS